MIGLLRALLVYGLLGIALSRLLSSSNSKHENAILRHTKHLKAKGADSHTSSAYQFPFQDPSLPWDQRVVDLANRLTVEEMVNQSIARYGHVTPGIDRLGIKPTQYITECLRGVRAANATAFPQALGLAASFRLLYSSSIIIQYVIYVNRLLFIFKSKNHI